MFHWVRCIKGLTIVVSSLLLVTFSATQDVTAASKSAPLVIVAPSQIAVHGDTVCGYVQVGKQKKPTWQPGTRVSARKFRPYSLEIEYLKNSLSANKKALAEARAKKDPARIRKTTREIVKARTRLGAVRQNVSRDKAKCSRITSLQFNTKNVVALAVVDKKTTKTNKSSAGVATSSTATTLVGLTMAGKTHQVITSADLRNYVQVTGTYQSPSGSLIIVYYAHPNDCLLGEIAVSGGAELCLLYRKQMEDGTRILRDGDLLGTSPAVQFDNEGGVYFTAVKLAEPCSAPGPKFFVPVVHRVKNGVLEVMPHEKCRYIWSWAAIRTGGALVQLYKEPRTDPRDLQIVKWNGQEVSPILEGGQTDPDGLQGFSNGDTLIHLDFDLSPDRSPAAGATYLYRADQPLKTWWHKTNQNPMFMPDDVIAGICDCVVDFSRIETLLRRGETLFGIGTISRFTPPEPVFMYSTHIFKMYPQVEVVAQIGGVSTKPGREDFLVKTDNWFLTAGRGFYSCTKTDPCDSSSHVIRAVNTTTFQETVLSTSSNGVAVTSIESSQSGDTALFQGIRLSDKKPVMALFDGATSPQLTWVEIPQFTIYHTTLVNRR